MTEIYRLAVPDDAPDVQRITHAAYVTIRELQLQWPAAHADVEQIRANIIANKCYVLEHNGQIVATVTLADPQRLKLLAEQMDLPFVMWFAVDPERQGSGWGRKLLHWVEQEIINKELGAPAVTLATAEKHPWLLPMYERWGYERLLAFDAGKGDGVMHLLRKIVNPERFALYEELKQAASSNADVPAELAQAASGGSRSVQRQLLSFRRF
ncbi:GNAT family N-acetyltransferase [Paenibacillus campi]|uniref:GNAT family N-acetyltransferase n=1 Tax=Paenibacillus campi TaxID=3106031 RepID=UPI002AFE4E22|nr:GNAT family N-acetyltransferase [Paenibacillus sp. SGZ-1009]